MRIPVRGTRHYQARAAAEANRLTPGARLILRPRPDNPYDRTAVEVWLDDRTMLGHVPRERSAEIFALVKGGNISATTIHSVTPRERQTRIEIQIEYTDNSGLIGEPVHSSGRDPRSLPKSNAQSGPPPRPAEASSNWVWWMIGAIGFFILVAS